MYVAIFTMVAIVWVLAWCSEAEWKAAREIRVGSSSGFVVRYDNSPAVQSGSTNVNVAADSDHQP